MEGVATSLDCPCERREPETRADVTELHIPTAHLLPEKSKNKKQNTCSNPCKTTTNLWADCLREFSRPMVLKMSIKSLSEV